MPCAWMSFGPELEDPHAHTGITTRIAITKKFLDRTSPNEPQLLTEEGRKDAGATENYSSGLPILRLGGFYCGDFENGNFAIGLTLESGGVFAEEFAAPPIAVYFFGAEIGEPLLIDYSAHFPGRRVGEGILGEEFEDVAIIFDQALFGPHDETRILPRAERGKPQIPIEARLIGRVNSRGFVDVLRLVTEGIGGPGFSVLRALELDFVAAVSHHSEQAVSIGDAERFEGAHGRLWKRESGSEHPD